MSSSIVPERSQEANIEGTAQIITTKTSQTLHFANMTGLVTIITIVLSFSLISHAIAQTSPRSELAKILVGDAIHALQKGDSNGALLQMRLADQELASAGNGTAIQSAKILVGDAIQAVLRKCNKTTSDIASKEYFQ
jgi:hypothetical protein